MATNANRMARITLELPPKAQEKLESLGRSTGQDLFEVIRRALATYDLLWSEVQEGNAVILRDDEGDKELIFTEFAD